MGKYFFSHICDSLGQESMGFCKPKRIDQGVIFNDLCGRGILRLGPKDIFSISNQRYLFLARGHRVWTMVIITLIFDNIFNGAASKFLGDL